MVQTNEAILVAARVRPPAERISRGVEDNFLEVSSPKTVSVKNGTQYVYDKAFAADSDQDTVFESIGKRIVEGCLDGYNGTVFAYGQTGSGKTYTMLGPPGGQNVVDERPELRGIIPRSVEYLFTSLENKMEKLGSTFTYAVRCKFAQLYNESFYDLLSSDSRKVTPRVSKNGSMYLAGAIETPVDGVDDVVQLMNHGLSNRRVAETAMNQESSRSHAIFTLELTTTLIVSGIVNVRRSVLNLVDLAGSERQRDTETNSKSRVKEACAINGALLMLGRVIRELADPEYKKENYVPYRDSGLTYLLKDSLGGNARTAFVVTVHPNRRFAEETISALRFAQDVKKVKNVAAINEDLSGENVEALKVEMLRLKEQLRNRTSATNEEFTRLQEETAILRARAASWEELAESRGVKLDQTMAQLRSRDFSIRVFHKGKAPEDLRKFIVDSQREFDAMVKDYGMEQERHRGNSTNLDVYQLSDRAEKAEEEVRKLKEQLDEAQREQESDRRRSQQIKEHTEDVDRRMSMMFESEPTTETPKERRRSEARARRNRRTTRFTLTPSRAVRPVLKNEEEGNGGDVRNDGELLHDPFQPEALDESEIQAKIEDLTDRLRSEQGATLRADLYANQLEQQLHDKDEVIRRYEKEENDKLVTFASRVEQLEKEKHSLTNQKTALSSKWAELEPLYKQKVVELTEMKHHVAELVKQRDAALAKEQELNTEMKKKTESLHERNDTIDELSARLEAYEACEGDLRKTNAELSEAKATGSHAIETLKMEKEFLMTETANALATIQQKNTELESAREQLASLEERSQFVVEEQLLAAEMMRKKNERLAELETQISEMQHARAVEEENVKAAKQEASDKTEKAEREFGALAEALVNVDVEVTPHKRRRSCFGEAINRVNHLADSWHKMKGNVVKLEEQRDDLASKNADYQEELERLREDKEVIEHNLEEVMEGSNKYSKITVIQRYRKKVMESEQQIKALLEENKVFRDAYYAVVGSAPSLIRKSSSNLNLNLAEKEPEPSSKRPARSQSRTSRNPSEEKSVEQKENAVPKRRTTRRVTRSKQ